MQTDSGFQVDDPEEMLADMLAISKWDSIREVVNGRLLNEGDDLKEICARGFASLEKDDSIFDVD